MIYRSILLPLIVLFTTVSLISVGQAYAAVDMFLKVDGIEGESAVKGYEKQIDVESWSWGAAQTTIISGGGAGSIIAHAADVSMQKQVDKASPLLLSNLAQGKHIKEATLTFVKTGPKPLEFLKYKFTDIIITSTSYGGSAGDDKPQEAFSMAFARLETIYTPIGEDGKPKTPVTACWDFKLNKACTATPPPPPPVDSDGDGVPDSSDRCPGFDDNVDTNANGVPDACETPEDADDDGIGDAFDNCPDVANSSQTNTDSDGQGDACDVDDDNDGILDNFDIDPLNVSTEFSDGTTSGEILSFGDQTLLFSANPGTPSSLLISASGGAIPAHLSLCSDSSVVTLDAGDEIDVLCGSITIEVISGPVEVEFFAGGTTVTTTLDTGDDVTFDTDTITITNNSPDTVIIIINGIEIPIKSGDDLVLDLTPPTVVVPDDITEEATSTSGDVVTYAASATDDTDPSPILICTPPSGSTFPLGTTLVTCIATDAFGNIASASFDVTVQDTTPPVVTDPPNVTAEATALCTPRDDVVLGTATATDIFEIVSITNDAPECFPLGDTLVHWTATDANGNSATTSTQTVTVQDTTPPTLVGMPADVAIEATLPTGVIHTYTNPTATDAVDSAPTVSCAPPSGSLFALGATIVECTASDFSGNTASASFTVDIQVCGMSASSFNLIVGTEGKDKIRGTSGPDAVFALGGNDEIKTGKGGDCIKAGDGNDIISGGTGDDTIYGESGNDKIKGRDGNDKLYGGDGKDKIFGNKGKDTITGGAGDDELSGGPDDDTVSGGDGNDKIFGRQGNDILNGDAGDDRLRGGQGRDSMDGGAGTDRCFGEAGVDTAVNCESTKSIEESEMEEEDYDD